MREIEWLVDQIRQAASPLIVAGRGGCETGAWSELQQVAETLQVPVMTTLTGKSAFPEELSSCLGTGGLSRPAGLVDHFLAKADLVVGFGTPFTKSHYIAAIPEGGTGSLLSRTIRSMSRTVYFIDTLIISRRETGSRPAHRSHSGKPVSRAPSSVAAEIAGQRRFLAKWADRLEERCQPISPYRVVAELLKYCGSAKDLSHP